MVQGALAESLYDYLFTTRSYPSTVSKSMQIAGKEVDRIGSLLEEVNGRVLFIPTDSAWNSKPGAFEAILNIQGGNVRYDMLRAASVHIPLSDSTTWSSIEAYAENLNGLLNNAYGTFYALGADGQVCLVELSNGGYVLNGCASIVGPPVILEDATVYQIDSLLIPLELESLIKQSHESLRG